MNSAVAQLLQIGFAALDAGINRETIIETADTMEKNGSTPEQVKEALARMRDEAIAKAEADIDKMP